MLVHAELSLILIPGTSELIGLMRKLIFVPRFPRNEFYSEKCDESFHDTALPRLGE